MILVCPSCEAKFQVPKQALGENGRKVRCAMCGHVWRARHGDLLPPMPRVDPQAEGVAPDEALAAAARAALSSDLSSVGAAVSQAMAEKTTIAEAIQPDADTPRPPVAESEHPSDLDGASSDMDDFSTPAEEATPHAVDPDAPLLSEEAYQAALEGADDDISVGSALVDGDDLDQFDEDSLEEEDFLSRRRAEQRRHSERSRNRRRRVLATVLAFLLLLVWVGVGAGAVLYKDQVIEKWPASRQVYALFEGMNDADQIKKELEESGQTLSAPIADEPTRVVALVTASQVETVDKRNVLVVYGYVENKGRLGARAPKVRATVLDSTGKVIDAWVFDPPGKLIARGKQLRFRSERFPIPRGAADVAVEIVEGQYSETEGTYPDF